MASEDAAFDVTHDSDCSCGMDRVDPRCKEHVDVEQASAPLLVNSAAMAALSNLEYLLRAAHDDPPGYLSRRECEAFRTSADFLKACRARFEVRELGGEATAMLCACSVSGDAVHARRPGERKAVCGEESVNLLDEPWSPDGPFACKRCARRLQEQVAALREAFEQERARASRLCEKIRSLTDTADWVWLGDGDDDLDSMSEGMVVRITAGDLRAQTQQLRNELGQLREDLEDARLEGLEEHPDNER